MVSYCPWGHRPSRTVQQDSCYQGHLVLETSHDVTSPASNVSRCFPTISAAPAPRSPEAGQEGSPEQRHTPRLGALVKQMSNTHPQAQLPQAPRGGRVP